MNKLNCEACKCGIHIDSECNYGCNCTDDKHEL